MILIEGNLNEVERQPIHEGNYIACINVAKEWKTFHLNRRNHHAFTSKAFSIMNVIRT